MTTMSGYGESMLWFRGREADIIIETEDGDDGEAKLLRICFARCDEGRDFECVLFSSNEEEWQRTTLDWKEMEILEGLPCLENFDETVEVSWREGEVEMDSIVIKDNTHVKLLQKIVSDRTKSRSKTMGAEMEGGTTLALKPRETEVNLNPFLEGSLGRETDTLVGRWASVDVVFSIDKSGEIGGEQVHTCMCLAYDEREVEEGFFLF